MDFIQSLINSCNVPLLTAFLLGILTSISPCPLATNIAAVAYISREIKTWKNTLLNGLFYTLGRGISYTILATLIYSGLSKFQISRIFQGRGEKILGPILIVIGLIMLGVIKINIGGGEEKMEKIKFWLAKKGYIGSLLLGILFALAFCPYSGVLFFAILIPLVLKSAEGLILPPVFALGTGLPVIIFSFLLAFSMERVGRAFQITQKIGDVMRYIVAIIFLGTGIYYMQYLVEYLTHL